MTIAKKVWKGEATIKATDAYGGGDADLAADEAWDFSGNIDLETDGYEGALVYLEHNSIGTTDNIIVGVFPSIDGADRVDDPCTQIEYDASSGADIQESPIVVLHLQHFEIGVKTSGTNDSFDYRIRWDAWRWEIS